MIRIGQAASIMWRE